MRSATVQTKTTQNRKGQVIIMMLEVIAYYKNTLNGISHIDKEISVPKREVSKDYMNYVGLLQSIGAKKRYINGGICYTLITDARHSTEYIFTEI